MMETRVAKQRTGGDVEALLKSRLERIPIGFMGDGRDTANAALFPASEEALHHRDCRGGRDDRAVRLETKSRVYF
jgi:hypothetical protein